MKLLFYIILALLPFLVFGNNENDNHGSITGRVVTSDGHPAAYVSVVLKNTGKGTITDDTGNFEIKKIKPGKVHAVVFRCWIILTVIPLLS